jgi:hypothetical protein
MGERLTIRLASKDGQPAGAIITLFFKNVMTYKYSCSDKRFANLGVTPFLLWKAIEEAQEAGMAELDLGRSDPENRGLVLFKDRLGAVRSELRYYRDGKSSPEQNLAREPIGRLRRWSFDHMPDALLVAAADLLYRHVG